MNNNPQQQHPHQQNPPVSVLRNRATALNSPQKAIASHYIPNGNKSVDFYLPTNQQANSLSQYNQLSAGRIDLEMQVLNHCFDDIERFVSRLQVSVDGVHDLEKLHQKCRNKSTKSKKTKQMSDELLAARAQLPQAQAFVDIFQKFKLSFNLLARLKVHIHDPSAPELVHFLINPLGLIVAAINKEFTWLLDTAASIETDAPPPSLTSGTLKDLPKSVWQPMLNRDAKELLFNCLNSKEQELWVNSLQKLFLFLYLI